MDSSNGFFDFVSKYKELGLCKKISLIMFFLVIVSLPFDSIPLKYRLFDTGNLYFFPFLFGFIFSLPSMGRLFLHNKLFRVISLIILAWMVWEIICIILNLHSSDFSIKDCIKETLKYTTYWCLSLFVLDIFLDVSFSMAWRIFLTAMIVTGVICGLYSVLEIAWLWNSSNAAFIMGKLTPYFRTVANNFGWWPPIFWEAKRFRSFFSEPNSFVVFLIPTITICFVFLQSRLYWLTTFFIGYLICLLGLTYSRGGCVLLPIAITVFMIGCLFAKIGLKNNLPLMRNVAIAGLLGVALFVAASSVAKFSSSISSSSTSKFNDKGDHKNGFFKTDSTTTRLILLGYDIKAIRNNLWFGAGMGQYSKCIYRVAHDFSDDRQEFFYWCQYQKYPKANAYTAQAVEGGIAGLILFSILVVFPIVKGITGDAGGYFGKK